MNPYSSPPSHKPPVDTKENSGGFFENQHVERRPYRSGLVLSYASVADHPLTFNGERTENLRCRGHPSLTWPLAPDTQVIRSGTWPLPYPPTVHPSSDSRIVVSRVSIPLKDKAFTLPGFDQFSSERDCELSILPVDFTRLAASYCSFRLDDDFTIEAFEILRNPCLHTYGPHFIRPNNQVDRRWNCVAIFRSHPCDSGQSSSFPIFDEESSLYVRYGPSDVTNWYIHMDYREVVFIPLDFDTDFAQDESGEIEHLSAFFKRCHSLV